MVMMRLRKSVKFEVKFLFVFGIVLDITTTAVGWRPFRLINHNVTAYSLSDDVSLNATVVGSDGISFFLEIKKEIKQPFVRFEICVDSGNGLIDLVYINETINMCRFFRNKSYQPFLQTVYRMLVEQGNYPTGCPIKKVVNVVEAVQSRKFEDGCGKATTYATQQNYIDCCSSQHKGWFEYEAVVVLQSNNENC